MPHTSEAKIIILKAAFRLFYQYGYKATGVDAIAKASGVTKATLYYHFDNKDILIEEALRYQSKIGQEKCWKSWNKKGIQPVERLTIIFDDLASFFNEAECYGCPFINAAAEYSSRNSPVRKICEDHFRFITEQLEQFSRDAKLRSPKVVAEILTSLIAGSYSSWYVAGIRNAAKQNKEIAEIIIKRHSAS